MKKGRQQVKQLITWLTAMVIVTAGMFTHTTLMAQVKPSGPATVNVLVTILPPYSPYYSDYSGVNASKVFISIQNLSNNQLKIKLTGGLTGNNGISITTYSNYTPLQPIILNPHSVTQLNGTQLKDIFDINNLSVVGVDKNQLARTSRIPEGLYNFCLQAIDYTNPKTAYSDYAPIGCTLLNIKYPQPPILMGPAPFSQVPVTTPQTVVFNWTNPGSVPMGTQYTIQMVEMPDVVKDPNQVLDATSLPMLSKTVFSLGYLYGITDLALTPGKKYAWRVIAVDPTGRTEFENKGVSPASVFVYGQSNLNPIMATVSPNTNLLNITNPDCNTTPNPTMVVGPDSKLNLNWLWHEQIDSLTMFGLADNNILTNYRFVTTAPGKQSVIKGYQVSINKVSNNLPKTASKKSVSLYVAAPLQTILMTDSAVTANGLMPGEDYTVMVTALDDKGNTIATQTSCTWKLRSENQLGKPKLNVIGRLAYAFDKAVYNGANKASISMQLVDYPNTKFNTTAFYKAGDNQAIVMFDNTKEIVSATTDASGNFKAQFTQTPTDTGHKYLMIRVNSPYYKNTEQNVPIIIPLISVNSNSTGVTYKQDTLKLGDIKTDVYNYNLTVTMGRGFSGGLTDAEWQAYGVNPKNLFGKNPVDTVSINPKAKIPAGMMVSLYRKAKANDIPNYEGDGVASGTSAMGTVNMERNGKGYMPIIKVADAATSIVYDANKNPKTVVVFKNLVCNFEQGDEYFIKAQLTAADTLGNSNKDATAPEQRVSFIPYIISWKNTHYEATAAYNIISKKPPTAHVKGRVVYQWPSAPGVLHPLAGQKISISMHSSGITGNYNNMGIMTSNCQYYPAVLVQPITQPDGSTYNRPVPQYPENAIVAVDSTDSNGNFDIEMLDLTQMGDVNVTLQKTGNTPMGPTCDEQRQAAQKAEGAAIAASKNLGSASLITGFTNQDMKDLANGLLNKVKNGGEMDGDIIDFGAASTATNNTNLGLGSTTVYQNGKAFTTGIGTDKVGFTTTGSLITTTQNAAFNNWQVPNFGPLVGANASGLQGQETNLMHLQQDDPFGPSAPKEQPQDYLTLERYFSLDGIPNPAPENKNAVNKPSHFVVQPFETVDLGTIITNVPELTGKINIYVNNSPTGEALANAKVVVFRNPSAKAMKPKYDGEGSVNHPVQKLLSPQFGVTASYISEKEKTAYSSGGGANYLVGFTSSTYHEDQPVEWVLDQPLNVISGDGNKGTVDLSGKRLYGDISQYALQITPDAEGTGGAFAPLVVTLPILNHESVDDYGDLLAFESNNGFGTQVIAQGSSHAGTKFNTFDPYGIYVEVSPTRVAGRVMNSKTGQGLVNALATIKVNGKDSIQISTLDTTGYFEVVNGNGLSWADNATININASADGYSPVQPGGYNYAAKANGSNVYGVIQLQPSATLYGKIVNESGVEVDSYIQTDDGTIYTSADLKTGIFVTAKKTHNLKILPKDVGYMTTSASIYPQPGTNTLQTITVYRLQHRMDFAVTASSGTIPDNTIQVIINNDPNLSKMVVNGHAYINFENVSVYNYSVQVIDTKNLGFIPKMFDVQNNEGQQATVYPVVMDKGATVTGHVTMNNLPVPNARVYIDYSADPGVFIVNDSKAYDKAKMETRTGKDGSYIISGIPVAAGNQVKLHATLDTTFTVFGGLATASITANNSAVADFTLTKFNGPAVNNIYGFPLAVENITTVDATHYKVTGIVDLSDNSSSFTWLNSDSKIRVSDVMFITNGSSAMQPVEASVTLDGTANLKMKYLDKYNVLLTSAQGSLVSTTPLTVAKNGNGGAVNAKVSITDNSFNFPSSYLSFADPVTQQPIPFYLSYQGASSSLPNQTTIKALYNDGTKTNTGGPKMQMAGSGVAMTNIADYYLSDINGNALQFKFIGFNTSANPASSFIDKSGKFHLDATVKGKIPNASPGDISVHVKNLVLDGNTIQASKGDDPIIVDLQTWKLQVNDWTIDPKQGGIYSKNSLVKTGIVDIPAGLFNLRSDLFVLDGFDVNNISLGGGLVKLAGVNPANAHLVYDAACGSDHGAHWRFSATGDGVNPVATIPLPAIPNKAPAKNLNVDYFQLVSYNNENLVNLSPNQSAMLLYNNNRFQFQPQSISSDDNSFSIGGQTKFDVPRLPALAMNLIYKKTNNVMDVAPGNLALNFEGKGYVQYTNDQTKLISIENGDTKISGTVVEPGKVNPIPCDLLFGNSNPGKIRLAKGYNLNLDGDGVASASSLSLNISDAPTNGMSVTGGDWSTLKFGGLLNDPKSAAMEPAKPTYNFEVLGDISASSTGIQMSQINTPLGDVDMTYDFPTKTMHGALHMNEVAFGSGKFTGDVQMTFDPKGMILLGAGSLNTGVLLVDGFGVFNIGVLFGNAPLTATNINTVTQYSKAGENKCWLTDNAANFKGFFINGGYDILNEHLGYDIGIASVYLNACLGVEMSVGANFNNKSYMALLGAHGDVDAGLSSITGTSISGGVSAHLTAMAGYDPAGFSIDGNAGIKVSFQVCQYVPFVGTSCFGGSKGAKMLFHYGVGATKFKFSLDNDGGVVVCNDTTNK